VKGKDHVVVDWFFGRIVGGKCGGISQIHELAEKILERLQEPSETEILPG
jgi:hypothetical protein